METFIHMKLFAKLSLTFALVIFISTIGYAQKRRIPNDVVVTTLEKKRFHGSLAAINASELVLIDHQDQQKRIKFEQISRVKVYKKHKDVGYALVTSALAAAAIVGGQAVNDGNVATAIAVGGTVTVVGLSMVLHNVLHGPEVSLKAGKDKMDYLTISEKLGKYILKDASVKP